MKNIAGLVALICFCGCDSSSDSSTSVSDDPSSSGGGTLSQSGVDDSALDDRDPQTNVIALAQEAGEASAEQCPNGGVVLDLGVDTNGNGQLDEEEVTGTEVVCHGRTGETGPQGLVGPAGPEGARGPQGGQGDSGPPGPPGVAGPRGGRGSDGESCTAEAGGEGYTITCPGSEPIAIRDGVDGQDGASHGGSGAPGESCSLEVGGSDYTIDCPGSDPITVQDGDIGPQGPRGPQGGRGDDGAACSLVAGGDDYTIDCPGSHPITIRDGANGADGQPGQDGLSITTSQTLEEPGANCAAGGTRLAFGPDLNGNGTLEEDEEQTVTYVCNGTTDGPLDDGLGSAGVAASAAGAEGADVVTNAGDSTSAGGHENAGGRAVEGGDDHALGAAGEVATGDIGGSARAGGATEVDGEEPALGEGTTLNYENYQRRPGIAYTPVPAAIPLPIEACAAKPKQRVIEGRNLNADCAVPEDTCALIRDAAELVCNGGMTVEGLLWMTSSSEQRKTLLLADFVEVSPSGEFYVTGETAQHPFAANAEIFLRHEYCGKPEAGFDANFDAATSADCLRKGKFQSMEGLVKIAGLPKTTWSLLTHDSRDTHAIETNLIKVDHCAGWKEGDVLSIAATGGDQETYQGVHNWCSGDGCLAKENSKSEKRTVHTITTYEDKTCDVVLTEALEMNHRGNAEGIGFPMLRIQAEVVNHSRSVIITGGYQEQPDDPDSRVATRYDYSNGGTPSQTYGPNLDKAPCRKCKMPNEEGAGVNDWCTEPTACQVYDAEGESIQLCGQDCSPIGMQGITTVQMHGGVMQMSHTGVEKCGRRELAEYCLHFHHIGDVKDAVRSGTVSHESYFVGNAVQEGINKGITIHGTHHALVQSNVVYNHQGPGIYIEDGNELFNVVEENVVMCSEVQTNNLLCKLKNATNRPETTDSDWNEVSGIYFLAAMNHTIGNRVFGYDNAMYVNRNTSGHFGLGMAKNKICTSAFPFGHTVGNVFHNNAGFGWYANTAFPQDLINLGALELSSGGPNMKGTVVDWSKCLPFSLTGEDHSFNVKVQKHVEYFNDFSAGVYSVGDITLENYITYGGNKGLYWKTYRRGLNSDPICVDCTFARTSIEGPGGSGHVEFKNSDFYRTHESYQVDHHCSLDGGTGGLCASHYDFRTSRFFEWSHVEQAWVSGAPHFYNGVTPTGTLIFTPDDKVLTHVSQNVGFDIDNEPRCQNSTPYAVAGWYQCDNRGDAQADDLELRIVRIYSPDRGSLTVTNHSEGDQSYTIPWTSHGPQSGGASAYGVLPNCQGNDCPNYMLVAGYVFSIPAGAEISLNFETVLNQDDVLADLFALEYSDVQMLPETQLTIRAVEGTGMMDSLQPCTIDSDHSRAFITPFGPIHGAAGAWYRECGNHWPLKHTMQALIDQSYQGDNGGAQGGDNTGNGGNGAGPNIDLQAAPETASPFSARVHPDPSLVTSLYTSIAGYSDSVSHDVTCRAPSQCSWPHWSTVAGECDTCDITWFPSWQPSIAYEFDYQLGAGTGQGDSDRILKVELWGPWFSLFEFRPGGPLDLSDYDGLHLEVWSPGITHLTIKFRDYGANGVWDADLDDIERTKALAFDNNLIPNQWSVLEVNLDELFDPNAPRNLGQMIIEGIEPAMAGMPLYLSNIYFYKRD